MTTTNAAPKSIRSGRKTCLCKLNAVIFKYNQIILKANETGQRHPSSLGLNRQSRRQIGKMSNVSP